MTRRDTTIPEHDPLKADQPHKVDGDRRNDDPLHHPLGLDHFEVFELLRIVETFATRFDELPELIPGRHDYRILISQGMLVPRFAVVGQLAPDSAVELIQLDVDMDTEG